MLLYLLVFLLISNAVPTRRDKSILFSRILIKSLLLTSFLAYSNLYLEPFEKGIYEGTFTTLIILILLLLLVLFIISVLTHYLLYCKTNPINWNSVINVVINLFFIFIMKIQLYVWCKILFSLGLGSFYIIPLVFTQILIASFYSIKNKSSLPGILYLSFLFSMSFVGIYILPDYFTMLITFSMLAPLISDNMSTCLFSEDSINNYDFTKDKNWSLKQGKAMYNTKIEQLDKFFGEFIRSNLPIDSSAYASKFGILHRIRLDLCQTGNWLYDHPNGLGRFNVPRLIGEETNIPSLKTEVPLPTHKNRRFLIDQKFR